MRRRAALLAALAPLAACINLAPAYHRPAPPVPAAVANGSGPASAAATLQSWRAFFGDARLAAVIGQAIANNRDLAAAVANVQIARSTWLIQRSQLFPTLGAQASATFGQVPLSEFGSTSAGSFSERLYTVEATSSYVLDVFGMVRNQTRAALQQYFATDEARRAAQISLIGQAAEAWLTIGADRSLMQVAADTLAEAGASLRLTEGMLEHGEAAKSDVDQARSLVAQARYQVGAYATQEAQDKDALDLLVGASVADALLPEGIDDEAKVMGELPTGVASSVLLERPDVLEAEDQLEAANADIGAARAAFFPQISLTGSYGVTSLALSSLFSPGSAAWTFVPQLTQPIFEGGKLRAGLSQAKAQRAMARATYEKAIQTAFREVADALAQRGQIDAELSAQQAEVDDAADAVQLSDAELRRGSASYLDVLTAERTLYSAQVTLATTRLLKATNLVALYQALGGGLS